MALNWPSKGSGELLDYTLNWAQALGTDTIVSSLWALSDASIIDDHSTFTGTVATVWLKGGAPNQTYTVTNTMTTAAGRIFVQPVNIKVTQ